MQYDVIIYPHFSTCTKNYNTLCSIVLSARAELRINNNFVEMNIRILATTDKNFRSDRKCGQ